MKVTFLGHAAFLVETEGFKALIDPYISKNPACKRHVEELKDITHIFVTHAHGDHMGDTVEIAKRDNSLVITSYELAHYIRQHGVEVHPMHIGGRTQFDFGKVKMTPALHGSGLLKDGNFYCGGAPCGFVIEMGGKKLYHAGDTGLTMDMQLLEWENIDLALIPIGGNFTMDLEDGLRALDFIKPKKAVPMHYNTNPYIKQDPEEFKARANCEVIILEPGEIIEI